MIYPCTDLVPDETLIQIYDRLVAEGTLKTVFYDGSVQTVEDFMSHFSSGPSLLYFIIDSYKRTVGIGWLNSFDQRTAQGHFVFFRGTFNKETLECGKESIKELLELGFDTLTGIVPVTNKLGNKIAEGMSMVKLGTIPNHCHLYYEDRMVGGNIYYINKGV